MTFDEWEQSVPEALRHDRLWTVTAYRLALFASDLCWHDTGAMVNQRRLRGLADQLIRAAGSVSANLAEGYSRSTRKDRARFYEYALGSARESRDWYYKARHAVNAEVLEHRLDLYQHIIRLTIAMITQQRQRTIHEGEITYNMEQSTALPPLSELLANVPT